MRGAGYAARSWLNEKPFGPGGHEPNEIAPVVQPFIIDWTAGCRVGGSFNAKDRAPLFHS